MTQPPTETGAATAGRGVDLFFGDDPETDSAPAAAAVDAAAPAADGEVADTYDQAVESAYTTTEVAVEEADALRLAAGEPSNGSSPSSAPVALPPPAAAAPPPASPPPPDKAVEQSGGGSSRGCLIGVGAMLLGALLGAALALALLLSVNAGLNYASRDQVADLANTAEQLSASADALRNDVATLQNATGNAQADLDDLAQRQEFLNQNLEALGQTQIATDERLTAVEEQAAAIGAVQEQVDRTAATVADLESQVTGVSEEIGIVASELNTVTQQVEAVAVAAQRSDNFLTGLTGLLASLNGETPQATAPLTETLVATPTVEVRATITPSTLLTETIAPTATITLTPTIAATVTVTPSVEATVVPTATVAPGSTGAGAIRGMVFFDRDRNGTLDGAIEPGIAGVLVTLYTQNRVEVARATTNFRGQFEFNDLTPGIYVVVENDPPNFLSSTPNNYTVRVSSATPIPEVAFGDYR